MGVFARFTMFVESFPSVSFPVITVSVFLDGVSPEDGARLLVRPLEREIRTIEGIVEVTATARESIVYLIVEFEADVDIDKALLDTREAVDRAKAELPQSAEEPIVREISADPYPTIIVAVSGDSVPERVLYRTARFLEREIETIPDVLSANLGGQREEVVANRYQSRTA